MRVSDAKKKQEAWVDAQWAARRAMSKSCARCGFLVVYPWFSNTQRLCDTCQRAQDTPPRQYSAAFLVGRREVEARKREAKQDRDEAKRYALWLRDHQ